MSPSPHPPLDYQRPPAPRSRARTFLRALLGIPLGLAFTIAFFVAVDRLTPAHPSRAQVGSAANVLFFTGLAVALAAFPAATFRRHLLATTLATTGLSTAAYSFLIGMMSTMIC